MLDLKELFPQQVTESRLIDGIYYNAQAVKPRGVFVALKGEKTDGHQYIDVAFRNGAEAVIVEAINPHIQGLQIVVPDTYVAISQMSAKLYPFMHPLTFIGVTGTDGKTSTTVFLQELLEKLGKVVGYIGTNGVVYGNIHDNLGSTTPLAADLFPILADMSKNEIEIVSMEVSSHALATKRVISVVFDYAVFTNFSRDHLDFHKTIAEYKKAKLLLFKQLSDTGTAIVNLDDAIAQDVIQATGKKRILTYSLQDNNADFYADEIIYLATGMSFVVHHKREKMIVQTKLLGEFNVYNILVAIAIAVDYGYSLSFIAEKICEIPPIPGRMELFYHPTRKFSVIVDFGHAPNAIKNVLRVARDLTTSETTIVTGAVGDGDKEKRPLMAEAALQYADKVIFTTDQPYSENPEAIIADMTKGLEPMGYRVIIERESAIQKALDEAQVGDVVVIMGKGREEEIQYKDHRVSFSDYAFVKAYMEK